MMPLILADIRTELTYKTSRSGGKGGQNVNKVSTKVEVAWNLRTSPIISEEDRLILEIKWANRLTKEGVLLLVSQSERTQLGNKRVVLNKLEELLIQAFKKQKERKPTRISKGVKEKRLLLKRRTAELKRTRGGNWE